IPPVTGTMRVPIGRGARGPLTQQRAGGVAMRPQRSAIWAAFLAVAALAAVGAGSARAADVIKFGISTPLSGPAAPWGIPHKQATELIFDEVNSQGGLEVGGKKYRLEVVAYDHRYVIAEGVATVNRLIAKHGLKYVSTLGGAT